MIDETIEQSVTYIPKNYMILAIVLLLLINIIAFVLMGIDKGLAKRYSGHRSVGESKKPKKKSHHRYTRIPEKVLLGLAVIGGGFGILLGMIAFHHKTNPFRHPAFVNGVPIILLVELIGTLIFFASMI